MALTGDGAAAAVMGGLLEAGVFDVISDDGERAAAEAATLAGLQLHYGSFIVWFLANVQATLPAGVVVVDANDIPIGSTESIAEVDIK